MQHLQIMSLFTNSECNVFPKLAGLLSTTTPAPSRAVIFEFASPLPPLTMAPAWPILLPGGALIPAIKLTTGLFIVFFSLRKSAASSSALPPISPIMIMPSVSLSLRNTSRQSMKFVPLNGSPPIPTTKDWPRPACVVWLTASYVRVPDRETMPTRPRLCMNPGMMPILHCS